MENAIRSEGKRILLLAVVYQEEVEVVERGILEQGNRLADALRVIRIRSKEQHA
jgi:hypothetical protein